MTRSHVAIVGIGKRVLEATLPALRAAEERFEITGLFARSARTIEAAGEKWPVEPLSELKSLDGVDLLYVAVGKNSVPEVLDHLARLDRSRTDLLLDTPVVRFKHFRHIDKLQGYRNTWVPEDCAYLPWIPPVRAAIDSGALGDLKELQLFRSAYAYHGLATAKAVLGETRITDGRRRQAREGLRERHIQLARGHRALIVEPRDYALGHVRVLGSTASISDQRSLHPGDIQIEVEERDGICTAIRVGDHVEPLSEAEASLAAGNEAGLSVIARQEAMKRVGLYRLLCDVHQGEGGYPLEQAIDDMVIDYYLEKLGRYVSTPLTNPRSVLARGMLKLLSRLGG